MNAIYMVYLPLLIISLIKVTDAILAKYFQKSINISLDVLIAFNIYNAIIACIYFSAADGFKISLNGITMLFSLVYAFAVASNHLLTFLSYSKTSVSFVSIVSTAGTIIVSTMFGLIFLGETLSLKLFVSLVLLVLAVIIPGFDLLKDKSQKKSDIKNENAQEKNNKAKENSINSISENIPQKSNPSNDNVITDEGKSQKKPEMGNENIQGKSNKEKSNNGNSKNHSNKK